MPFDFQKLMTYKIDYRALEMAINKVKILDDTTIQREFVGTWLAELEKYDKTLVNQVNDPKQRLILAAGMADEPQTFQEPLIFPEHTILLHFRITVAAELLKNEHHRSQTIEMHEFIEEKGGIKWTPVKGDLSKLLTSTDPIIMVPFRNGTNNHLVIDGNHRITKKVDSKAETIEAMIVAEQSVYEHKLCSSTFDLCYYLMHNELQKMAILTEHKGMNANELVEQSFLMTGNFLLDELMNI